MEGEKQMHLPLHRIHSRLNLGKIVMLIKETVRSKNWKPRDKECNQEELCTLQRWHLRLNDSLVIRAPKNQNISPTTWTPPPIGFIKINFDGASKGNPGPSGYGAVIKNPKGEILILTVGYLGETTNNAAELIGLLQGLQIAVALHSHRIILEGDSQIIIQLITKILHGESPQKISPSWRLSGMLEDFKSILRDNLSITPSHVKRGANRVADCLENEGVSRELEQIFWEASNFEASDISKQCQTLAIKDFQPPDGVPHGVGWARGEAPGGAINGGQPPSYPTSYEGHHFSRPPPFDEASHSREQANRPEH
jgi:ribonuclease HI